jgi:hypothetical protein
MAQEKLCRSAHWHASAFAILALRLTRRPSYFPRFHQEASSCTCNTCAYRLMQSLEQLPMHVAQPPILKDGFQSLELSAAQMNSA